MTDEQKTRSDRLTQLIAAVPVAKGVVFIGPHDEDFLVRVDQTDKSTIIHYLREWGLQIEEDPNSVDGVATALDECAFFVFGESLDK